MDYSRVIVFFHSGFTFRDFWFGISSPLPCSSISRSLLTPSSLKQSDSDGVLNLLQLSLCSSSSKAAWISSKGRWRPAGSEARGSKGSEESNYFTLHVRRDPRFFFFYLKSRFILGTVLTTWLFSVPLFVPSTKKTQQLRLSEGSPKNLKSLD